MIKKVAHQLKLRWFDLEKGRLLLSMKSSTSSSMMIIICCIIATASASSTTSSAGIPISPSRLQKLPPSPSTQTLSIITIIDNLRGGGIDCSDIDDVGDKKQKRKSKSSKKSAVNEDIEDTDTTDNNNDAKDEINSNLKQQTDAATSLGNGIRSNASILRRDKLPYTERIYDSALVSLGLSLGTSGTDTDPSDKKYNEDGSKVDTLAYYQYGHTKSFDGSNNFGRRQQNGEYVKTSTSAAVLANYFLKTHGGTHIIQCLLSLLASVLGVACLLLPTFPSSVAAVTMATTTGAKDVPYSKIFARKILLSTIKYQLLQQTLLIAMTKHITGLIGAILLGASRIPQLGVRNARKHLELVATDPVGQYMFYCSCLVVWMGWFGGSGSGASGGMKEYVSGLRKSVISIMNASAASASSATSDDAAVTAQLLDTLSQQPPPWFLSSTYGGSITPILILGPVLLREVISILWVFSDVLTLAVTSSDGMIGKFSSKILSACRHTLDVPMSILITSEQWRKADSFQRQRTLSKLVSRTSFLMELVVGCILIGDAAQSLWTFAFGNVSTSGSGTAVTGRLTFKCVLGKMACAHLYLNFLQSRRKKIKTVIGSIRGGNE